MRDRTTVTRLERALATLEALLVTFQSLSGRLEYLLNHGPSETSAPHTGDATPPIDKEAQDMAEKYIERRTEELEMERFDRDLEQ